MNVKDISSATEIYHWKNEGKWGDWHFLRLFILIDPPQHVCICQAMTTNMELPEDNVQC